MAHVSRPLIALLLATVAFFALWLIALKPGGSSGGANGSASKGLGQYQPAIDAAHQAVTTAGGASARAGGADPAPAATTATPNVKAPARPAVSTATAGPTVKPRASGKSTTTAKPAVTRLSAVERALHSHKVLALLFYNPAAPDDRAVDRELGTVPTHGGRVFKLAIPLNEIEGYMAITDQVAVNYSPTLVLVAPNGRTDEIVGFADPFEISQRVGDALALTR